jgi:hypothetical protein
MANYKNVNVGSGIPIDISNIKIYGDTRVVKNYFIKEPTIKEEIIDDTKLEEDANFLMDQDDINYDDIVDLDDALAELQTTDIEEEIIEEEPIADSVASEPKAAEPAKQISFEDLLVHDYQELDFVKVEDVPVEVEKANKTIFDSETSEVTPPVQEVKEEVQPEPVVADSETSEPKVLEEEVKATIEKVVHEPKISSLNDRLNKTISFGLNDRIGFEKKLFGGSSDDFYRVVSQLNTFDSFDEAKSFVLDFVKPDYNNWEGCEEFETRFMEIVEKKFS